MYHNNINNQPRQSVTNKNISESEIQKMKDYDLKKVNTGWTINKMFDNNNLSGAGVYVDFTSEYEGFITDYFMVRKELQSGSEVFYIKFFITVRLPYLGVGYLTYEINANFTPNSNLCNFLFDLGYNIGNISAFELDILINIPVWVFLKENEGYLDVSRVRLRQL